MSPICFVCVGYYVCKYVRMYVCILLEATSFLKASLSFYQMAVLRPITPYYSPRREILRNLYNFLRYFSRIN